MKEAKRRLTVYPGQTSIVLNDHAAKEILLILRECIGDLPNSYRPCVHKFIGRIESALETSRRLSSKQSVRAKGSNS